MNHNLPRLTTILATVIAALAVSCGEDSDSPWEPLFEPGVYSGGGYFEVDTCFGSAGRFFNASLEFSNPTEEAYAWHVEDEMVPGTEDGEIVLFKKTAQIPYEEGNCSYTLVETLSVDPEDDSTTNLSVAYEVTINGCDVSCGSFGTIAVSKQ